MNPKLFAQAIVSIERKYGLRLDAQYVWLRLDEFKKVKELKGGKCNESKGWYGLKGACKRGKKGEGEVKSKESKLTIASKIRDRKGMKDRLTQVKLGSNMDKEGQNSTKEASMQAKATRVSATPAIDVKKLTEADGSPSSFIATTKNGEIEIEVGSDHSPTWAQNEDGITVSGNKSRQFYTQGDIYSMQPDQFKSFIEKVRQDPAYSKVEEFRLGNGYSTKRESDNADLDNLKVLERVGLISLTDAPSDQKRVIVNFDKNGKIRKATTLETDSTLLRAQVSRMRYVQSTNIGSGPTSRLGDLTEATLKQARDKETSGIQKLVETEDKLYGRKNTKTVTEAEYIAKAEKWAKSQGLKGEDGSAGISPKQSAKNIAHPATHDLVGLDSAGIHSYFGGLKTSSGKKSLLGEEAIVNVVEHLSRGDTLEGSVMSGVRVARILSRDATKKEREYARSPKFLQDLNNLGEKALRANNFEAITKVVRESTWESGAVTRAGNT